ncbi:MAG: sel1 repeat family protein [Flavobacteriales bacterium]|nr:sel1 repeat family protein [Flavobacteriales bacterium]
MHFRNGKMDEGFRYAKFGIARKDPRCMFILANHYACQKPLIQPALGLCVRWLGQSADAGDREAMLALGLLYCGTEVDTLVNATRGMLWIRRSAEVGNTDAMLVLAHAYATGTGVEASFVRERYWLNQAALRGVGNGALYDVASEPILALFEYIDLRPTRYVEEIDSRSGVVVNSYYEGPSAFEMIGSTLTATYAAAHVPRQEVINSCEHIMDKDGHAIYAATISSRLTTEIQLSKGEELKFSTTGWIEAGTHAGTRDPDGRYARDGAGAYLSRTFGGNFDSYNHTTDCRHASFIGGVLGSTWACLGKRSTYIAPADGLMILGVNDKDYVGNRGYFDVEIVK